MKLRLRLLLERHRDDRWTVSVLDLPPERAGGGGSGGAGSDRDDGAGDGEGLPPLGPRSALTAYGEDPALLARKLAAAAAERFAALGPEAAAAWRFFPDQRLERVLVPVLPEPEGEAPEVLVPFALVLTPLPRPPHAVFVPKLGLHLAVDDLANAPAAARAEIAAVLRRRRALRRLPALFALHPAAEERLDALEVEAAPRRAEEVRAERAEDDERARERRLKANLRVLESVATDLRAAPAERAYEREALVAEVAAFLAAEGDPPDDRARLLVAPAGAGKTAIVAEAIRRTGTRPRAAPVFAVTGSRLVAGMSGLGEWQERCRAIVEAARARRIVLAVGDPHELVESGRALGFDVSIAQYLKRPIEQGHVRVIAECTEEAQAALERRDRGFAALFRVVRVPEPDRPATLAILRAVAADRAARGRAPLSEGALGACHDLHARFAPYQAFPGKAVRFLERLEAAPPEPVSRAALTRAFARATGLPEDLLAAERTLDPDSLRAFLRARVVGQDAATGLVADLVARLKAGLADARRPLASLLFLGPTGVGKTETAKALAELLFGSRERLIRLDMTEYQDGSAARRLIAGPEGSGDGDLTRRVRAEPLSVVLLDEVEKADPGVFDLLLQALGDARLTDARGRATDFRSAIVILTSNLGAELPAAAAGFGPAGSAAGRERFLKAAEGFFRPELLNRLDAIVPFDSLSRGAIARIAGREIERALERDGLARREVAVEVAPDLVERAIEVGFDPRFGARPLKRAVERTIVNPIARWLAGSRARRPARRVRLDRDGVHILDEATGPSGEAADAPGIPPELDARFPARLGAEELLRRLGALRRRVARLLAGDVALDRRDALETARREAERLARRRSGGEVLPPPEGTPGRERIRRIEGALERVERAKRAAEDLEDLGVAVFLEGDRSAVQAIAGDVERLEVDAGAASFGLRAARFESPDGALVLLAPVGREESIALDLSAAYVAFARERGYTAYRYAEGRAPAPRGGGDRIAPLTAYWQAFDPPGDAATLASVPRWTGAVLVLAIGPDAAAYFAGESGRHRQLLLRDGRKVERFALVRAIPVNPRTNYGGLMGDLHTVPRPGEAAAPGIPAALPEIARIYDETADPKTTRDPRTGRIEKGAVLGATWTIPRFAAAWLEREGSDAGGATASPSAAGSGGGAGGAPEPPEPEEGGR